MISNGDRTALIVWIFLTAIASLVFVFLAGINLGNFYPVSADDVWIMSASYKLASQGIFGSDLYAGFYNADRHYFIALPVHHFLQAISFKLFGGGIVQARLPALISSLILLWVTSWLAFRWFGPGESLLTTILLLFWRSNLIATEPRTPLLAMGQSGRYDALAVALVWISILLLYRLDKRPRTLTAFALGIAVGLATLTQFFGGFVLILVALVYSLDYKEKYRGTGAIFWFIFGFTTILAPYIFYISQNHNDFLGQAILKGNRVRFGELNFYLNNLLREPYRFLWMAAQPFPNPISGKLPLSPLSPWILVVGFFPAAGFLILKAYRRRKSGHTILGTTLLVFGGCLALFDQTKAPLYAVLLFPSITMLFAVALKAGVKAIFQSGRTPMRVISSLAAFLVISIILVEGIQGYLVHLERSRHASRYMEAGQEIADHLPPGAFIIGAERWWWALRGYPYLAINGIWARWQAASEGDPDPGSFQHFLPASNRTYIIVNNNVRGDIRMFSPSLQDQFWTFLERCAPLAASWENSTYGLIEIYAIQDCYGD